MIAVAGMAAVLAGLLHVLFFVLESVLWSRPETWKRFGVHRQADADVIRPMALNQGYYNLFLAVGALVGAGLLFADRLIVGRTLVAFACACMVGAALVLVISNPKMARAAAIQGTFALIAVVFALAA